MFTLKLYLPSADITLDMDARCRDRETSSRQRPRIDGEHLNAREFTSQR